MEDVKMSTTVPFIGSVMNYHNYISSCFQSQAHGTHKLHNIMYNKIKGHKGKKSALLISKNQTSLLSKAILFMKRNVTDSMLTTIHTT